MKKIVSLGVGAALTMSCSAPTHEAQAPLFSCATDRPVNTVEFTGNQETPDMLITGVARAIDDCYRRAPAANKFGNSKSPYSRGVTLLLANGGAVEFRDQFNEPPKDSFDPSALGEVDVTLYSSALTAETPTGSLQEIDFLKRPKGWSMTQTDVATGDKQTILPDENGQLYTATPSGEVHDQGSLKLVVGHQIGRVEGLLQGAQD